MEVLNHFLLVLIITSFYSANLVQTQDQSGFISIDCGLTANTSYTEDTTGINYISDAPYIETGISNKILPEYIAVKQRQVWSLRSFPEGVRNCYNIKLRKGDKYKIKVSFMYGNYDEKNELPRFDLHLGPNFWDSVIITDVSTSAFKEIIHVIPSNRLQICLVNTDNGIPFISSIELRLLQNSTYTTQAGSLELFTRLDIGPRDGDTFRYKEDVYDRSWWPFLDSNWKQINTSLSIDSSNDNYQPPLLAMRTAGTPIDPSLPMNISFNAGLDAELYAYMHFAEIEKLQANESRKFNISYNGYHWYGPYSPYYLVADFIYSISPSMGGKHMFSIYRTEDSTHPPILNAIEMYLVKNFPQSETVQKDVDAILNIKSNYGLKRINWQGDPCAPRDYLWEGLNCSYNDYDPPRIVSLDLSSSQLTGEIPPSIESLTQLENLDLSNNNLTGPVPEFLAKLQFLKVLNLEGNKLSGTLPSKLLERSNNGLKLRVEGNPDLCASSTCEKKKKTTTTRKAVVPVVSAVASFFVLIIIVLAVLWRFKWRKVRKPLGGDRVNVESEITSQSLETKKKLFTYAEVQRMTNNFERILGKGGFGIVFHGYLEGTQVAVKMLSLSSVQGTKQFQAEDLQAKLADFGLSKPFPVEGGTHVSASIAGTPGYLDPEYYVSNRLTEKNDVYSFGIVLLEIITSRPVIAQTNNERTHISQWVSSMLSMGDIKRIVDPRLQGDFDVNSVWKAVEVAMACLSPTSARRPTMNQIVTELSECLSAERASNGENESLDSVGLITMNLGTMSTPLAR
ncbi:hypothetical protein COLO4_30558 [Corchorus olitorius]|uniref:Protein kinase domain-containing protein n=1 Tax=Corchorus olitorius TaxID=93759 RepID=A0A1R3H7U5_9ROSI|nr:hypothetical protein COLO4_30558 [Corchorus olitorius]